MTDLFAPVKGPQHPEFSQTFLFYSQQPPVLWNSPTLEPGFGGETSGFLSPLNCVQTVGVCWPDAGCPGFLSVSTLAAALLCDLGQAAQPLGCGFSICATGKGPAPRLSEGSG